MTSTQLRAITTSSAASFSRSPNRYVYVFITEKKEQPERQVLKLSDAYGGDGDIEVKVTMLNVNYGKNKTLMDKCRPLMEYAWLVDTVRKKQDEKVDLESAVDAAIDEMSDSFEIYPFLVGNRAEVKTMFLTEYNEEKVLEQERAEGRTEAMEETLHLLIMSGKICREDADEIRTKVREKLRDI